jgi:hypothetical protein
VAVRVVTVAIAMKGTAEDIQRVAGAEMIGSRGHRDKNGWEEMKVDNFGPWPVEEVQRAANSLGLIS